MLASNPPEVEITFENFTAVCRECAAGTLNNRAIPLFAVIEGHGSRKSVVQCKSCGSTHVNVWEMP